MLRRYSGIKPSHLWHKTPIKDFYHFLKQRLTAIENWEQRERKSLFQVVAIVIGSGLGFNYTLGRICPGKILDAIIPQPCTPQQGPGTDSNPDATKPAARTKKCAKPKTVDPCPPEPEPELKPCPKCGP